MALINRIARLFKADMHSVLDTLEEPLSVLKQAVREMSDQIEHGEKRLEDLNRRIEKHHRYLEEQEQQFKGIDQQIDLCFRAGNEKLARTTLRRKLEIAKRIKLAEREGSVLATEQERLVQELSNQKAKLASIKEKMEIIADDTRQQHVAQDPCARFSDYAVSDEELEVAFLAERERRAAVVSSHIPIKEEGV